MSEIADIIKQIARQVDRVNTFAAIVTDQQIKKDENGKKEYTVTVRKLSDVAAQYDKLQEILDSSYKPQKDSGSDSNKSKKDNKPGSISKIEYKNVRLKAAINGIDEGVILIPRLGSWVLVSVIDDITTKLFVSQYSEIDQVILRIKKPQDSKPQDSDSTEEQAPEYFEIDFNATTLGIKFGDLFETNINKELFNVKFLQPKEEESEDNSEGEDPPPQKVLSELSYAKDTLDITFLDEDEKPRATIHADQENLNINFIEDEKVTTEVLLNKTSASLNFNDGDDLSLATVLDKDKVHIAITDGCTAMLEKQKATIATKDGAEEISLAEGIGITLKSAKDINIEAGGDLTLKGENININ